MKARVKYYVSCESFEDIDLQDYGVPKGVRFEDLPVDEQIAITDTLAEDKFVLCNVTTDKE